MDMHQWFKEAQYGMMAHWGLYSLLAGEYRGVHSGNYSEWIQSNRSIPIAEYEKLAQAFNPVFFDAEEWIRLAKECGMKYFVITSKHHDGFALFHSKADKFNVVDATPFKRDIVGEIAEACYKHGLKLGLYYSQDLDWHEPHGGGYLSGHIPCAGTAWCNNWDFPEDDKKDFNICFQNKIYPQVEEILRNYGELCLIWFDVPMTIKEKQSRMLYDLIKKYQPNCLINSRIGNGAYDYVSLGDNEIPDYIPEEIDAAQIMSNDINGFKPSPHGLYETAATINNSWGYCAWDQEWKSASQIASNRKKLAGLGINYLLNVGPDGLGRIPAVCQQILREVCK
ncbi:MAG: alpha-L-fucosidase [Lachnospiraceae bacterium]|nr:alpha-L-fucosidase [Lachnospiraceae bacterium]